MYYPMDVDDVLDARSSRPDRLLDVAGAGAAAHHGDCVPVVPLLDVPVPQMVSSEVADVLGPCFVGSWGAWRSSGTSDLPRLCFAGFGGLSV